MLKPSKTNPTARGWQKANPKSPNIPKLKVQSNALYQTHKTVVQKFYIPTILNPIFSGLINHNNNFQSIDFIKIINVCRSTERMNHARYFKYDDGAKVSMMEYQNVGNLSKVRTKSVIQDLKCIAIDIKSINNNKRRVTWRI